MDHRTGYGDMGSDSHSNEQMSLSDESVESSNDADDYDTQRAEVLLSKTNIDGLFWTRCNPKKKNPCLVVENLPSSVPLSLSDNK